MRNIQNIYFDIKMLFFNLHTFIKNIDAKTIYDIEMQCNLFSRNEKHINAQRLNILLMYIDNIRFLNV